MKNNIQTPRIRLVASHNMQHILEYETRSPLHSNDFQVPRHTCNRGILSKSTAILVLADATPFQL